MSKVCIFGGSGSFGVAMTKKLLTETNYDIIIFSRNEKLQFEHKQKVGENDRVSYVIGDIRDKNAVDKVLDGSDYVILASAMKHIDKCEQQPYECFKTNIEGCINVINSSIEHSVKKLIFLSTDKASNPTTIYGCSKLFIEMYCQSVAHGNTQIVRTRYGNILGSNGSVAWIFDKLARDGKKLTVTNPDMTRFFMSINQATALVYKALLEGEHGELYVWRNKSCTIKELADIFSDNQEVVGTRCIEKTDEALLTVDELNHSRLDGDIIIVNKNYNSDIQYTQPLTSDNTKPLTHDELEEMIKEWREYENIGT